MNKVQKIKNHLLMLRFARISRVEVVINRLFNEFKKRVLLSRNGAQSLYIAYSMSKENGKRKILIPSLFCSQTLRYFRAEDVEFVFYELDYTGDFVVENFCTKCLEDVCLIVWVSYFGISSLDGYRKIKNISTQFNCKLFVDFAHVFPGEMNTIEADFIMYSLHKHFPIPDGSLLLIGSNEARKDLVSLKGSSTNWIWFLKRFYKIIFYESYINKYLKKDKCESESNPCEDIVLSSPSRLSMSYLNYLTKDKLNSCKSYKLKQALTISIELEKIPNWKIMKPILKNRTPYLLPFVCESEEIASVRYNALRREGVTVMMWPDLPRNELECKEMFLFAEASRCKMICFVLDDQTTDSKIMKVRRAFNYD